jgi:prepilin-type processing-associated H-X9-DG protein
VLFRGQPVPDAKVTLAPESFLGPTFQPDPTTKMAAHAQRLGIAIPSFHCPSRRRAILYPTPYNMYNANATGMVAKTDYAVNCGSQGRNEIDGGPAPGSTTPPATPTLENGISYRCSTVRMADVVDGTTQTIAVGEKYLALTLWATGNDAADNENMYVGYDNDLFRSTNRAFGQPRSDSNNIVQYTYGGPHPGGFNIVLCDGSVRVLQFDIDITIYELLGRRADRTPLTGRF